jgi:DNA repair exonuclease SbcCD ATPase subunit
MRLETAKIHGFGTFRDLFVDLTKLAGPLVAVTGPNGAGKSTFLELALPGACYRKTPTRGSLGDLANARDASLEVRLAHGGATYTLRHLVDSKNGNGDSVALLDGSDKPLNADAKKKTFDEWAKVALPAPEILFAAMFAPQGAGGFLAMDPGPRKGVLLRVLGVERLELLAERARKHAAAAKAELTTVEARVADEVLRSGDVPTSENSLYAARKAATETAEALAKARADLADVEAAARLAEENERGRADVEAARDRLKGARETADGKVRDLEGRIANNRAVLADADSI